jgi:hypothetical protein
MNDTEFGNIIDECRKLLACYVRRQANRVTNELAQATRFTANPQVFNYCPPYVELIIMNEIH